MRSVSLGSCARCRRTTCSAVSATALVTSSTPASGPTRATTPLSDQCPPPAQTVGAELAPGQEVRSAPSRLGGSPLHAPDARIPAVLPARPQLHACPPRRFGRLERLAADSRSRQDGQPRSLGEYVLPQRGHASFKQPDPRGDCPHVPCLGLAAARRTHHSRRRRRDRQAAWPIEPAGNVLRRRRLVADRTTSRTRVAPSSASAPCATPGKPSTPLRSPPSPYGTKGCIDGRTPRNGLTKRIKRSAPVGGYAPD